MHICTHETPCSSLLLSIYLPNFFFVVFSPEFHIYLLAPMPLFKTLFTIIIFWLCAHLSGRCPAAGGEEAWRKRAPPAGHNKHCWERVGTSNTSSGHEQTQGNASFSNDEPRLCLDMLNIFQNKTFTQCTVWEEKNIPVEGKLKTLIRRPAGSGLCVAVGGGANSAGAGSTEAQPGQRGSRREQHLQGERVL